MISGTIFDIKKFALHDGPGLRTTIFLKGCPLACAWCHNPEGIAVEPQRIYRGERCVGCGECAAGCPQKALDLTPRGVVHDPRRCIRCGTCARVCPAEATDFIGETVTVPQVLAELEKDRAFYDQSGGGVTVSGGEPLMQPQFLLALLRACGEAELHRCVDTTGYADKDLLLAVARQTDLFLYDLKHMDSQRHRHLTGVPNGRILENLALLAHQGAALTVRIPIVPGLNDELENMIRSARFVAALPGPPPVQILPFHCAAKGKYQRLERPFRAAGIPPPGAEQLKQSAQVFRNQGLTVTSGGE